MKFWKNVNPLQYEDFLSYDAYACDEHHASQIFFYKKLERAAIFDLTQKYGVMYCFDLNLRGKQNWKCQVCQMNYNLSPKIDWNLMLNKKLW